MGRTEIWRIEFPEETTSPPDIPAAQRTFLEQIDTKLSPVTKGLLSARPAAGKIGQRYWATDRRLEYLDIGAEWVVSGEPLAGSGIEINEGTIRIRFSNEAGLNIQEGGLVAATDQSSLTREGNQLRIKPSGVRREHLATSLRPEAGASAEAEALRSLGTNAGTAAAGNDSRLLVGNAATATVRKLETEERSACAGNDSRLSNERTPSAESVTQAKLSRGREGTAAGCFMVAHSVAQRIGAGGSAVVVFNVKSWDPSSWFTTETGIFRPLIAGYYRISALVQITTALASGKELQILLQKNGGNHRKLSRVLGTAATPQYAAFSTIVEANGSTDNFNLFASHNETAELATAANAEEVWFCGELIGKS